MGGSYASTCHVCLYRNVIWWPLPLPTLWNTSLVEANWNVMAHAQKPDFVFRRNGRVHLNRRGRQFSRLLAAEVCASAVVVLDTPCSEVVWRVLATHSIRQFPLHFPCRASPCAITFQLESSDGVLHTRLTWRSGRSQCHGVRGQAQCESLDVPCDNFYLCSDTLR